MNFFTRPVIQIAGIIDKTEADLVCSFDIDTYGFPLRLPVHSEDLTEQNAQAIIKSIPSPPHPVLITYLDKAESILGLSSSLDTNTVQLHGEITPGELQNIKKISPELILIKSLIIGKYSVTELKALIDLLNPYVDAFITDTWDSETGAEGATGRTHDWSISRKLCEYSEKPVILAGGLNAENVSDAIEKVRPSGVDVHTGIEDTSGRKDPEKLKQFVLNARIAFGKL